MTVDLKRRRRYALPAHSKIGGHETIGFARA